MVFSKLASKEAKEAAEKALLKRFSSKGFSPDVVVDLDGGLTEKELKGIQGTILTETGYQVTLMCHEYVDSAGPFWFVGVVDYKS